MRCCFRFACLKKPCSSTFSAVGRMLASFFRQASTIALNCFENEWACASMSRVGGRSATVFKRICAGVYRLCGARPVAISMAVMPNDQMSAYIAHAQRGPGQR